MNKLVRSVGLLLCGAIAFSLVGCGESDEMPVKKLENGRIVLPPDKDNPEVEATLKYAVNLGDRAATRPRQTAIDALDKVEKKLKSEKPADLDKKLAQIQACRERIAALGEFLRDQTLYARYIQPKTGPDISFEAAEKKLADSSDAEYMKLKKTFDASKAKNEAAFKKMMDVAGEFKVDSAVSE